jgi:hypothetical protein
MNICPINVKGRSAIVTTLAVGRYGAQWKNVDTLDGRSFTHNGAPILPPPEWKVLAWVRPIKHAHPKPHLTVIK